MLLKIKYLLPVDIIIVFTCTLSKPSLRKKRHSKETVLLHWLLYFCCEISYVRKSFEKRHKTTFCIEVLLYFFWVMPGKHPMYNTAADCMNMCSNSHSHCVTFRAGRWCLHSYHTSKTLYLLLVLFLYSLYHIYLDLHKYLNL